MADYFVDHGAYGAANRLGIDVPAWGVPQEGDGTVKDASASSAVASIKLTAQPAVGDTVIIAGASFNAIATAPSAGTASFQVGGTLQATVNNLAAAISGCTATTLNAALVPAGTQIRNVLYARSIGVNGGALADTVEIMCRAGTQRFNYNATTNLPPTITSSAWAGGVPPLRNSAAA